MYKRQGLQWCRAAGCNIIRHSELTWLLLQLTIKLTFKLIKIYTFIALINFNFYQNLSLVSINFVHFDYDFLSLIFAISISLGDLIIHNNLIYHLAFIPVSYTHLDVYKRQQLFSSLN